MNSERLFEIIESDLKLEIMKNEEELERIINSDLEIEVKTITIRNLLKEISLSQVSLTKFKEMLNIINKNN